MKTARLLSVVAASAFVLGGVESAMASTIVVYEDQPTADSNAISHHASGGPVLADDFVPTASGLVSEVYWWGSATTNDLWEVGFHTDAPGVPNIDDATEGAISQHFVNVTGVDPDGDGIYLYTAAWTPMDMAVSAGTEYWFSVANASDGWTWALADGSPEVGSQTYGAVVSTGNICSNGGPHCGPWNPVTAAAPTNFAFGINVVPEPATLLLMGLGMAGMGFRRFKAA